MRSRSELENSLLSWGPAFENLPGAQMSGLELISVPSSREESGQQEGAHHILVKAVVFQRAVQDPSNRPTTYGALGRAPIFNHIHAQ